MHLNSSTNMNPIRSQNKSCPAGGTYSHKSKTSDAAHSVRGVIVAPPSGNTATPNPDNYQVLHKGFDTLALAVQANIPPELFEYLDEQKAIAEKERRDILVSFNGVELHLKGHGGNGYRFIASGGPFGANWFFKKPNSKDKWGIRVSFGSKFLGWLGLEAAKIHLDEVLAKFGIRYTENDISISRVDFCVDILANEFALEPDNFIMHSSTKRRDFITDLDKAVHGKSGRATSVTVGSTRNRQVIIYDKRDEVIQQGKTYWWDKWNETRAKQELPPLDPKDRENSRVWRVEFRAGKDLLKDRWDIRTWEQLHERFGDLCCETGEAIRYASPNWQDANRARWQNHLIWEIACSEMNAELFDLRSGCDPNPVKEVIHAKQVSIITQNIRGCCITLAALNGKNFDELPSFFQTTAKDMSDDVKARPEIAAKQLSSAKERYVFLDIPDKYSE